MQSVEDLRTEAARCRRLARYTINRKTADILYFMAAELEAMAAAASSNATNSLSLRGEASLQHSRSYHRLLEKRLCG